MWTALPPASWCWPSPPKAIESTSPCAPSPSSQIAGFFIVSFEPRLPSTHSNVYGALGDQVVDVGRPVLDRRVAAARARLDDDLDHRRVERVGRVDRRRADLDVVHVGTLVDDDQRPFELAHVLGVDPEIG